MEHKLTAGQVVRFKSLSQRTYHLYKSFKDRFPILECPCKSKKGRLWTVTDVIGNGAVILTNMAESRVTISYDCDLEVVYDD